MSRPRPIPEHVEQFLTAAERGELAPTPPPAPKAKRRRVDIEQLHSAAAVREAVANAWPLHRPAPTPPGTF